MKTVEPDGTMPHDGTPFRLERLILYGDVLARSAGAVGNSRQIAPDLFFADQCVQLRLACSVGDSPTGGKVRTFVAWVASVEETKRTKPTDEAIFGMASESPGRNAREPSGGLEKK
jgi:hypothetical protein